MQVTCIGGACVDRSYRVHGNAVAGSSNPATRGLPLFGGVARNVSENLARLRIDTALFSAVGNDALGQALLDELRAAGVDVDLVKVIEGSSDEYAAILERGELVLGAADMRAIESLSVDDLDRRWETLAASAWLFVDCNLSAAILQACLARRSIGRYRLAIDGGERTQSAAPARAAGSGRRALYK
jgi:pseudouridine kinase